MRHQERKNAPHLLGWPPCYRARFARVSSKTAATSSSYGPRPDPRMNSMNETILLLASDQGIRSVIEKALELAGYTVLTAVDVGAAEDLLQQYKFDLLIVRPYTESVSGHDAAMYLRLKSPGIPVLIVAGMLDDVDLETREAVQNFYIFPKPFSSVELVSRVKEVLLLHPHSSNT